MLWGRQSYTKGKAIGINRFLSPGGRMCTKRVMSSDVYVVDNQGKKQTDGQSYSPRWR